VSVCAVEESPWLMYGEDAQGRLQRLLPAPPRGTRRQDLPPAYRLNGAIYIADVAGFLRSGALVDEDTVPHVMPPERSVDIDTLADFERAAQWLAASAAAPT
jgi:CMP-N-acetylneuraminic acid synthetase